MSSADLNTPQVLVVDDDQAVCSLLQSFLSERGCFALLLRTTDEAVEHYRRERPAAVLLELVMPGVMDGLAALRAFTQIDRDVPIIVMSGQGYSTTVVQAMKLGAWGFVSKPFDGTDLEGLLANALRRQQLTREVAALRQQLHAKDMIERAAATAVEAGRCSLKDISRTAAREAERELILKMLQHTHWNRKETADVLGISYKALLYKIKQNGLSKTS